MSNPRGRSDATRLVYSTDPRINERCEKCREVRSECSCGPEFDAASARATKFTAVLRIEKSGRAGKAVTVIDGLPRSEAFLKDLTKKLKNKCGAGGTYRLDGKLGALIEIQGERREQVRALLAAEGIATKG